MNPGSSHRAAAVLGNEDIEVVTALGQAPDEAGHHPLSAAEPTVSLVHES